MLDSRPAGNWHHSTWADAGGVKSYQSSRASVRKLEDILTGDYARIVRVPHWCMGFE
jgi:hypothetical protein